MEDDFGHKLPNLTKLYKSNGEEWNGTLRSLAKECNNFVERSWEVKSKRYVTDPKTGKITGAYDLGELVREVHYKSDMKCYIEIVSVWENGKQMYPKVEHSKD